MELDEAQAERFEDERSVSLFWLLTPAVITTRVNGHIARGALSFYTHRVDRILKEKPRIAVFHDWRGITGFDQDIRTPYREWGASRESVIDPTFLVQSRMLAMALSVSALVIGRELEVLSNAAEFNVRLRTAVVGSRRTPLPGRP